VLDVFIENEKKEDLSSASQDELEVNPSSRDRVLLTAD
jgi:hypothetical protein